MGKSISLNAIKTKAIEVAQIYSVKSVVLFGSYANGQKTKTSDIDLLVDFGSRPVSLLKVAGFKVRMEELTGKEVDVVPAPISPDSFLEIGKVVPLYG
jgi:predicted nucleotidyltransferase